MAEIDFRVINRLAENPKEAINKAEDEYHAHIKGLARKIADNPQIKIILLAGPSGSGKTTSANMLADTLRAYDESVLVVSLDDFYKNSDDPSYPRTENGERDYECPESLHLDDVLGTLGRITSGLDFEIPKYDFKTASRTKTRKYPPISHGCVIIEGLHALNPKISDPLPREKILKLFVSVSTNINDGNKRILSGRKLRFIRRMVRDSIYRGADAKRTLEMWKDVLYAEDLYLYPYKETADVSFDTFHAFEPCVMSSFAKNLISEELEKSDPYAAVVINAIRKIKEIDVHAVPQNSLIREFIPGGIYENLY